MANSHWPLRAATAALLVGAEVAGILGALLAVPAAAARASSWRPPLTRARPVPGAGAPSPQPPWAPSPPRLPTSGM